MSNPAYSRQVQLLRAVDAEIRASLAAPLAQPAALAPLLLRAIDGFDELLPDVALAAATRELRDQVYLAPGHDRQCELLWREALTTSLFAARIARARGRPVATACVAGLLHRLGDALALQAIGRAEQASGAPLDAGSRGRITNSAQHQLAESSLRNWRLPAGIAAAVLGWRQSGEPGRASSDASAVYVGHLLAIESLHPEFCAPGLVDSVAATLGLAADRIDAVRSQGVTPREFLLALG